MTPAKSAPQSIEGPLRWHCLRFDRLSLDQLYALLQRRAEVFVVEQNCPYLDIDGKDRAADTHHLLAEDAAGAIHAYLRLLAPGVSYGEASLGRVITSTAARGSGLGHELMQRALAEADRLWPRQPIRIGAQAHLQRYYARHGFITDSAEYLEDDIPHVEMLRAGR